jgi:hypothetical protein
MPALVLSCAGQLTSKHTHGSAQETYSPFKGLDDTTP